LRALSRHRSQGAWLSHFTFATEHAEESKQFCNEVQLWKLITVARGSQLNTSLSWYADSSLHGRILLIVCHTDARRNGRDKTTLIFQYCSQAQPLHCVNMKLALGIVRMPTYDELLCLSWLARSNDMRSQWREVYICTAVVLVPRRCGDN
jgi:hypothetical protein